MPPDVHPRHLSARSHAAAGNVEEARRFAQDLEQLPMNPARADALAHAYSILGDWEKTIEWLEWEPRSFAQPATLLSPSMDQFREEPRFQALLRGENLALEPGWSAPVPLPPEREGLAEVAGSGGG